MGVFVLAKAILKIRVTGAGDEPEVVLSVVRPGLALQFQNAVESVNKVFAIPLSVSKVKDPKIVGSCAVPQQESCVRAMYFGSDRVIVVHVSAPDG